MVDADRIAIAKLINLSEDCGMFTPGVNAYPGYVVTKDGPAHEATNHRTIADSLVVNTVFTNFPHSILSILQLTGAFVC